MADLEACQSSAKGRQETTPGGRALGRGLAQTLAQYAKQGGFLEQAQLGTADKFLFDHRPQASYDLVIARALELGLLLNAATPGGAGRFGAEIVQQAQGAYSKERLVIELCSRLSLLGEATLGAKREVVAQLAEQARAQVLGINPAWVVDRLSQPWLEEEDESASCRNVVKNATPVIELLEKLDSMDPAYITLLAQ